MFFTRPVWSLNRLKHSSLQNPNAADYFADISNKSNFQKIFEEEMLSRNKIKTPTNICLSLA